MPERWRTKLSELPTLQDPEQVWTRATERGAVVPPGGALPPRRQRVLAGVVAVVVFAAAGAFAFRALSSEEGRRLVGEPDPTSSVMPEQHALAINVRSGDGTTFRPSATIAYATERIDLSCYSGFVTYPDGTGEGIDAFCAVDGPLVVDQGAPVSIVADEGVTVRLDPADPTASVGRSGLTIDVTWPANEVWTEANAEFVVDVRVVDPTISTPTEAPEADQAPVHDLLRIRCDEDRTVVLTPVVRAQSDGLHFMATDGDDESVLVLFRWPDYEGSLESGVTTAGIEGVLPIGPGIIEVACVANAGQPTSSGLLEFAQFELTDPMAHFTLPTLDCNEVLPVSTSPGARDTRIRSSDVLEPFGYAGSEESALNYVVVHREGRAIAWLLLFRRDSILSGEACTDSDFPLQDP